ncbi:maltokinase [Streptomyces sp. NPDC006879]|uniref:maltokinase N-terminal cap-like domain-containing protein n=1 Tax=Streptomyces sp. NPDC006879 TaxID=3364767 RepID=UPI0036C262F8
MSEAVSTAAPPALLPSLDPLLRAWLPRQRWFAGKGRPLTHLNLLSATELLPPGAGPGLIHLLLQVGQGPGSTEAGSQSPAEADCYQLLLGVRPTLPFDLEQAAIGKVNEGPLAGHVVYEGLRDPRLAVLLLERLRTPGRLGPLRFDRDPATQIPAGLAPRPLSGEQSNSSLVYGDSFILKVFRRVGPGTNPDLELPRELARVGCTRVPAPVAWYEADSATEPVTLGVLQPYLRGSADGWQLALHRLAAGQDFTPEARALGRATAEVHTALAEALPTLPLHRSHTEQLAADMTARLALAVRAVPDLQPYAAGLRAAFDALAARGTAACTWPAQRVHGDLHLGQTLRTAGGQWAIIDFEGEPARPLAERRLPQPPVRDIAGMLRSFDYAARSHDPWDPAWADRCRAAYCEGYARTTGRDPREEPELLRAFETDKAVYEVVYEARHRPDWIPVPMAAIHRLAGPVGATALPRTTGPGPRPGHLPAKTFTARPAVSPRPDSRTSPDRPDLPRRPLP